MSNPESPAHTNEATVSDSELRTRLKPRLLKLVRRVHLYAGLFLLPWVFLYGITGAMFNHVGLLPTGEIHNVPTAAIAAGHLRDFPAPEELARQVVTALHHAKPAVDIKLSASPRAAFNNELGLETRIDGTKHIVRIDPADRSAWIMVPPTNHEQAAQSRLLDDVRNVRIDPNPYHIAQHAVPEITKAAGLGTPSPTKPVGWCKLNFLADIDGKPARVTYVLRDGHVDITHYTGEDGMLARQFFLRLHTSHGRSPDWSGRNIWSLFVDGMAFAMVMWGITGLLMWWQLKSIRLIGAIVLLFSVITAVAVYFGMVDFYATTKL